MGEEGADGVENATGEPGGCFVGVESSSIRSKMGCVDCWGRQTSSETQRTGCRGGRGRRRVGVRGDRGGVEGPASSISSFPRGDSSGGEDAIVESSKIARFKSKSEVERC